MRNSNSGNTKGFALKYSLRGQLVSEINYTIIHHDLSINHVKQTELFCVLFACIICSKRNVFNVTQWRA